MTEEEVKEFTISALIKIISGQELDESCPVCSGHHILFSEIKSSEDGPIIIFDCTECGESLLMKILKQPDGNFKIVVTMGGAESGRR